MIPGMTEQISAVPGRLHQAVKQPRWKLNVLVLAVLMCVAGAVGQFTGRGDVTLRQLGTLGRTVESKAEPLPGAARSVVGDAGSTMRDSGAMQKAQEIAHDPTWRDRLAHGATRLGFSLAIGVVLGVIGRIFLRITVVGALLLAAIVAGMSYFHIINIDLTPVKEGVEHSEGWLADQAGRLKAVVLDALPSTGAGVFGFIMGFKK